MIDPYVAAGLLALWALMATYDGIATAYDAEQRKIDWDYCQHAGRWEVLAWWWRKRAG